MNEAKEGVSEPLADEARSSWLDQLTDVVLASDGFVPFRDNIDHAARHGVRFITHPGGSTGEEEIAVACVEHGITLVSTGIRLFHH